MFLLPSVFAWKAWTPTPIRPLWPGKSWRNVGWFTRRNSARWSSCFSICRNGKIQTVLTSLSCLLLQTKPWQKFVMRGLFVTLSVSVHRQPGEETNLAERLHTLHRSGGRNWERKALVCLCYLVINISTVSQTALTSLTVVNCFLSVSLTRRRASTASMSMWSCCMKTSRRRSEELHSSSNWLVTRTTWRNSYRTVRMMTQITQ